MITKRDNYSTIHTEKRYSDTTIHTVIEKRDNYITIHTEKIDNKQNILQNTQREKR